MTELSKPLSIHMLWDPLLSRIHTPTQIIDITLIPSDDLISSIEKVKLTSKQIIFDATIDPFYNRNQRAGILNNWVKQKGLKAYLATSQFQTYKHSHLQEILYPCCFFMFKNQSLPTLNLDLKQKRYSCLNRNPLWHRLLFYVLLKEKKLLNQTINTFYNYDPYNNHKISSTYYALNAKLFEKYFTKAMESLADFPIALLNDKQGVNDHSINHLAYLDAECNLATESTVDVEFTSEKTWKPIASGQCFHIVGSVGTNAWLRSFGLETFDNVYDSTTNTITRLEQLVNQLDGNSMWTAENLDKIKHNYDLFHSGEIEKTILNPLDDILDN